MKALVPNEIKGQELRGAKSARESSARSTPTSRSPPGWRPQIVRLCLPSMRGHSFKGLVRKRMSTQLLLSCVSLNHFCARDLHMLCAQQCTVPLAKLVSGVVNLALASETKACCSVSSLPSLSARQRLATCAPAKKARLQRASKGANFLSESIESEAGGGFPLRKRAALNERKKRKGTAASNWWSSSSFRSAAASLVSTQFGRQIQLTRLRTCAGELWSAGKLRAQDQRPRKRGSKLDAFVLGTP